MSEATISDDIALRIALAARVFPDLGAERLIRLIEDAIGLPPTAKKLGEIKVKDLKAALGDKLVDIDTEALTAAVAILKGEASPDADPPPPVEPYADGEMPGSIRVACASNGGDRLDGHFGSARRFLIYQVSSEAERLIDVRVPDDSTASDKNGYRATLIDDCQILHVASIGGPAAAKVIKAGVHPIKDPNGAPAPARIAELKKVLASKPPPWLAKFMGRAEEERVRFEPQESDA